MTEENKMSEAGDESSAPGRFAYDGLERLLHERSRLGILTSLLSRPEGLSFNELKSLCSLTDGNLSRHLQALSEAGLVQLDKHVGEKRPRTISRLTDEGRSRFRAYIAELSRVVGDAHPDRAEASQGDTPPGWARA